MVSTITPSKSANNYFYPLSKPDITCWLMTFRSFQSLNWAMLTGFSIIFNGLTSKWYRSHSTLHQQMSLSQNVEVPLKQLWPFLCWGHKSLQHLGDDITALCFYFCMCQTDIRRECSRFRALYSLSFCSLFLHFTSGGSQAD